MVSKNLLKALKESSQTGETGNWNPKMYGWSRSETGNWNSKMYGWSRSYASFVEALFYPLDNNQYSALYHAAINGHANLVKLYLSFYHVGSYPVYPRTRPYERKHLTYREIYGLYGNKKVNGLSRNKKVQIQHFTLQDYDAIIRDSTDHEVLQVLSKRSYPIQDSIKCINTWNDMQTNRYFQNIVNDQIQYIQKYAFLQRQKKKKMSNKPSLNFGDDYGDYDVYDPLEEDSYDHDEEGVVSDNDLILNEAALNDPEHKVIDDMVEDEETDLKEMQNYSENLNITDCDVLVAAVLDDIPHEERYENPDNEVVIENTGMLSFDSDFDEQDYDDESSAVLVKEEDIDPSCDDNWDVLSRTQTLKNQDIDSDWDALSSVRSVKSIDTFHSEIKKSSYKDMLTKKGGSIDNTHRQNHKLCMKTISKPEPKEFDGASPTTHMSPIIEDSCYDEHGERDGYKYGRGGKNAYMFRGSKRRGANKSIHKTKAKNYRKGG